MNIEDIKELIKLVDVAGLQEVELEQANVKIKLKRNADIEYRQASAQAAPAPVQVPAQAPAPQLQAAAPQPQPAASAPPPQQEVKASADNAIAIKSPMTGTFYASSSPENPPFVTPGQAIKAGDPVCIVEAMKLFNEIESEHTGTVEKVLVQDGQPVELDQPLFLLTP